MQRLTILAVLGIVVVFLGAIEAKASIITPYNRENAIKAIIGEAESEGLEGMLAVGCAIRARHSLEGVYGVHAPRVVKRKYSQETYKNAIKAWDISKSPDKCEFIGSGSGWGNKSDIAIFKRTKWFKNCSITAQVGRHYFYKCDN